MNIQTQSNLGSFAHPIIAVDAKDKFTLGLAAVQFWSWNPNRIKLSKYERERLPIEQKESYRDGNIDKISNLISRCSEIEIVTPAKAGVQKKYPVLTRNF